MTRYVYPSGRVAFDDNTGHDEASVNLVHSVIRDREYGVSVYQKLNQLGEFMCGDPFGINYEELTAYIAGLIGTSQFLAHWSS